MVKKTVFFVCVCIGLMGCATTQDQTAMTQLQLRMADLEQEQEMKDEAIKELSYQVKDLSYAVERLTVATKQETKQLSQATPVEDTEPSEEKKDGIIRVSASTSEVQKALQGAGYYSGPIDDKIGEKTINAIVNSDFTFLYKSMYVTRRNVINAKLRVEIIVFPA